MLPFNNILNPKPGNSAAQGGVNDYTSELNKRASKVFGICKLVSESQMVKRNEKLNQNRKFKQICVGDRVYIKNNIRIHKFIPRYSGPWRVSAILGSTVYVYSLAGKKHKQINMDKVRYAGDLSQDKVPDLLKAYPEDEPEVIDDPDEAKQKPWQPPAAQQQQQKRRVQQNGRSPKQQVARSRAQNVTDKAKRHNHRYNLRKK